MSKEIKLRLAHHRIGVSSLVQLGPDILTQSCLRLKKETTFVKDGQLTDVGIDIKNRALRLLDRFDNESPMLNNN